MEKDAVRNGEDGGRCYEDIIHLPHHVSAVHPPMPMEVRAAQFSPFAALTGYEEAIRETGRLTEEKAELEEDEAEELDRRLSMLQERIGDRPEISVTYFKPDARKSGGAYVTAVGRLRKIDMFDRVLVMVDGTRIPLDAVRGMEGIVSK